MSEGALAQPPKLERRPSARARAEWRAARLFQRRAKWLLLETLRELTEEGLAYVSQRAVAQRTGVAPGMASYWLGTMEEYGLIDRGRDALPTYNLILTSSGETALRRCNERLEAAWLTG